MNESQEVTDIIQDMLDNSEHHIIDIPEDLPICGVQFSEDFIYHDFYLGMTEECKRSNMCPVCLIVAESRDRIHGPIKRKGENNGR